MEHGDKIAQNELHLVCRLCLNLKDDLRPFFPSKSMRQLQECTGIIALPDHRLPSKICTVCISQLSDFHAFFTKCHRTNNYVESIIAHEIVKQEVKMEEDYDPFESENEDDPSPIAPLKCEDEFDNSESSQIESSNGIIKIETLEMEDLKDDTMDSLSNDSNEEFVKSSTSNSSRLRNAKNKSKVTKKSKKKGKKCPNCKFILPNNAALTLHLKSHDSLKYICQSCKRRFISEKSLKSHITRMHSVQDSNPGDRQICVECGKSIASLKHMKIHMRIHTGEMPYQCTVCMRRFTQIGSLISHKRIHTGEKPFVCHLCGRAFTTRAHLRRHQSVHTKEKPFVCKICDKGLKSGHALVQHNKLHNNEKDHVCEQCGLSFLAKINLDKHKRLKHSEKSGQCNICKKMCPDLKDHMVIHTGEKPYQCESCDKKFQFKRGLLIHNHKHKYSDKFKCDIEGCSRTFSKKWVFDCHMREHTGELPFVCKHCNKSYPRVCHLTQHLKLSHPDEINLNQSDNEDDEEKIETK